MDRVVSVFCILLIDVAMHGRIVPLIRWMFLLFRWIWWRIYAFGSPHWLHAAEHATRVGMPDERWMWGRQAGSRHQKLYCNEFLGPWTKATMPKSVIPLRWPPFYKVAESMLLEFHSIPEALTWSTLWWALVVASSSQVCGLLPDTLAPCGALL